MSNTAKIINELLELIENRKIEVMDFTTSLKEKNKKK